MIRKQTLDNGITLLTESMEGVRSVTIGVWLQRGSRNERAELNGISHFIEHLVFKGTRNRTARQIALDMDSVGGQLDAFTSKEYTCFYAKVLDENLPHALDLLADIVQRPLFDAIELERERQVVLEEIRMVEDTPDDLIYDLFTESFYPDHPLGRPIQGTEDTVAGMSRAQLLRYFRSAYKPGNMLIAAAGNLKGAGLPKKIERAFDELTTGGGGVPRQKRPRAQLTSVVREKRDLEQLHLLLGLPAFEAEADKRYPLHVLNALLGGTMSSRLFQRIREERGLAYNVYSAVSAFRDCGFLNVYVGTSPDRAEEVVDLVAAELRDLRDNGPSTIELDVAKQHLKGSLMLGLESTSSRMSNLARQEIYFGGQISLDKTLAGIDNVSVDDVHELARRLFGATRLGLAAVGRLPRASVIEQELTL